MIKKKHALFIINNFNKFSQVVIVINIIIRIEIGT